MAAGLATLTLLEGQPGMSMDGEAVIVPIMIGKGNWGADEYFYCFDRGDTWKKLTWPDLPYSLPEFNFQGIDLTKRHRISFFARYHDQISQCVTVTLPAGSVQLPDIAMVRPHITGGGGRNPILAGSRLIVRTNLHSLTGNSVGVSYSFDGCGDWSTPVSYPLGTF
jgi:hypothetical protein